MIFAIGSGGGSLTITNATSDASGFVQTAWTLGTTTGAQSVSVTSAGLAGSPLTFDATATPGDAVDLVFSVAPSTAVNNSVITPPVEVSIVDGFGNVVTAAVDNIDLAIDNNPSTGVLGGTTTVAAGGGIATFSDLTIDQVGSGYTLLASATGLNSATSASFNITSSSGVITWVNASGGNWSTGSNWSSGTAPTALDTVLIALAGTYTVNVDVSPTVAQLTVDGASGIQTLLVSSQTLTANSVGIGPNATVTLSAGTLAAAVTNGGLLFVQGGSALQPVSLVRQHQAGSH